MIGQYFSRICSSLTTIPVEKSFVIRLRVVVKNFELWTSSVLYKNLKLCVVKLFAFCSNSYYDQIQHSAGQFSSMCEEELLLVIFNESGVCMKMISSYTKYTIAFTCANNRIRLCRQRWLFAFRNKEVDLLLRAFYQFKIPIPCKFHLLIPTFEMLLSGKEKRDSAGERMSRRMKTSMLTVRKSVLEAFVFLQEKKEGYS